MLPPVTRQRAVDPSPGRAFSARGIGRVAVLIWHTEVSIAGARAIGEVFAELRKRNIQGGMGFLTIADCDTDLRPSAAARQAVAKVIMDYSTDIRAAAIAYEAGGFRATIVRSVITAINLASSTRFPNRVFSDTRDAMAWLADELKEPALVPQLVAGVNRLRRP